MSAINEREKKKDNVNNEKENHEQRKIIKKTTLECSKFQTPKFRHKCRLSVKKKSDKHATE